MKKLSITLTISALIICAGCHTVHPTSTLATLEPVMTSTATSATESQIDKYEGLVAKFPKDAEMHTQLGLVYIQKGRETGDLAAYVLGQQTLQKATELDPKNGTAWQSYAMSMTISHKFHKAIELANKAISLNAKDHRAYGVLSDSYLELGDYDKALKAAQTMIDLKPDLASYSRGAKLRQVFGDNKGAALLFEQAINAGSPHSENTAWCRVMLGELYLKTGAAVPAEQQYQAALRAMPGYRHAQFGLGKVKWVQNKPEEAVALMEKGCVGTAPIPYLADLGDLYASLGKKDLAVKTYARIEDTIKSYHANGIEGEEIQVAMYKLDHDLDIAESAKIAEHEMSHHQTVEAYMALAWAQYKVGKFDEAVKTLEGALRTNVQDSLIWYRAAKIYEAAGEKEKAMKMRIKSESLNPRFSILFCGSD